MRGVFACNFVFKICRLNKENPKKKQKKDYTTREDQEKKVVKLDLPETASHVIFIIDNSRSMETKDVQGRFFFGFLFWLFQ